MYGMGIGNSKKKNVEKGGKGVAIGGIAAGLATIVVGMIVASKPDLAPVVEKYIEPGLTAVIVGVIAAVLNYLKHRNDANGI